MKSLSCPLLKEDSPIALISSYSNYPSLENFEMIVSNLLPSVTTGDVIDTFKEVFCWCVRVQLLRCDLWIRDSLRARHPHWMRRHSLIFDVSHYSCGYHNYHGVHLNEHSTQEVPQFDCASYSQNSEGSTLKFFYRRRYTPDLKGDLFFSCQEVLQPFLSSGN